MTEIEELPEEASGTSPPASESNGRRDLDPMGTTRQSSGGVIVGDNQFLVAGGEVGGCFLSSCKFYDGTGDHPTWWDFPKKMPAGRARCGVAAAGGRVYVMGGMDDGGTIGDVVAVDIKPAAEWEALAPMAEKRQHFACASRDDDDDDGAPCVYVFGGWGEDGALATAERYDAGTGRWESLPKMPAARYGCAAGRVGDRVYVVGGSDKFGNPIASTFVYDLSRGTWDAAPPVPAMTTKRTGLSVAVAGGRVVAVGGDDCVSFSGESTMEVLDTETNAWVESPAMSNYEKSCSTAGFLRGTEEIIIAGTGKSHVGAECIPFKAVLA